MSVVRVMMICMHTNVSHDRGITLSLFETCHALHTPHLPASSHLYCHLLIRCESPARPFSRMSQREQESEAYKSTLTYERFLKDKVTTLEKQVRVSH